MTHSGSGLRALFDRVPRSHVRLGDAIVSTFAACGAAGVPLGIGLAWASAAATGGGGLAVVGMAGIAAAAAVGYALVRRRRTGREELVLLEVVFVVLGAVALALAATGAAVTAHLDLLMVGLSALIASGRVGCLVGGCCWGVTSELGLVYSAECFPPCDGRRRFPVQALEVAVWTALALSGAVIAAVGAPGSAAGYILGVYGITRLGLERLRGDRGPRGAPGRYLLPSSAAVVGLVLSGVEAAPRSGGTGVGLLGLLCVVALALSRDRWLQATRRITEEDMTGLRAALAGEVVTDGGLRVWRAAGWTVAAAEEDDDVLGVSLSRAEPPLVLAEADVFLAVVAETWGVERVVGPLEAAAGLHYMLARVGRRPNPTAGAPDPSAGVSSVGGVEPPVSGSPPPLVVGDRARLERLFDELRAPPAD